MLVLRSVEGSCASSDGSWDNGTGLMGRAIQPHSGEKGIDLKASKFRARRKLRARHGVRKGAHASATCSPVTFHEMSALMQHPLW